MYKQYKLIVQLLDLNASGNPVIHELHSKHVASIQEALESYDGKEAFKIYLEIEDQIFRSINDINQKG